MPHDAPKQRTNIVLFRLIISAEKREPIALQSTCYKIKMRCHLQMSRRPDQSNMLRIALGYLLSGVGTPIVRYHNFERLFVLRQ